MRCIRRMGLALLAVLLGAAGAAAQEAYFGAVAEFFALPRSEVAILAEWPLPADEIPVVLFLARRAGISPEALVALRDSGRGWSELAGRYRVDASHFHVPLGEGTDARRLDAAYRQFRGLPPGRWGEVSLRDEDIVALVNLRVLSQTLRRSPDEILAQAGAGPWADLYARLMGGSRPGPAPR